MVSPFEFCGTDFDGAYLIKPFCATDVRGAFIKDYSKEIFEAQGIKHDLAEVQHLCDEVMILRVDSLNDEDEIYSGVDDEETLQAVFDIFKDRYRDDFDFE